jgi:hypothetical protein
VPICHVVGSDRLYPSWPTYTYKSVIPFVTLAYPRIKMIIPRGIIDVGGNSTSSVSPSMVCDNVHHCRTVPGIVFNCLSTMFLCTWVAFHPDVPESPEDAWWKKFFRRIKSMAIAFLAPEYVFWNAFWEWVNSGDAAVKVIGQPMKSNHAGLI